MAEHIIAFLRDARRLALAEKDSGQNSRELAIVLTHIDTAILWRQEDLILKDNQRIELASVNK